MFLFKNDFGIDITLNVVDQDCAVVNVSASTVKEFEFEKPDGTIVVKTASFVSSGLDGKLKYTVDSGLLDTVGTWSVRAKLTEGPSKIYRTEKIKFSVKA